MPITKVWVEPGCISCHFSEDSCPAVFEVLDEGAVVKPGVDFSQHEAAIREAAEGCPVQVIKFEES